MIEFEYANGTVEAFRSPNLALSRFQELSKAATRNDQKPRLRGISYAELKAQASQAASDTTSNFALARPIFDRLRFDAEAQWTQQLKFKVVVKAGLLSEHFSTRNLNEVADIIHDVQTFGWAAKVSAVNEGYAPGLPVVLYNSLPEAAKFQKSANLSAFQQARQRAIAFRNEAAAAKAAGDMSTAARLEERAKSNETLAAEAAARAAVLLALEDTGKLIADLKSVPQVAQVAEKLESANSQESRQLALVDALIAGGPAAITALHADRGEVVLTCAEALPLFESGQAPKPAAATPSPVTSQAKAPTPKIAPSPTASAAKPAAPRIGRAETAIGKERLAAIAQAFDMVPGALEGLTNKEMTELRAALAQPDQLTPGDVNRFKQLSEKTLSLAEKEKAWLARMGFSDTGKSFATVQDVLEFCAS